MPLRETTSSVSILNLPGMAEDRLPAQSGPKPCRVGLEASHHVGQLWQSLQDIVPSSEVTPKTRSAARPSGGSLGGLGPWRLCDHQALGACSWLGRLQRKPFCTHSRSDCLCGSQRSRKPRCKGDHQPPLPQRQSPRRLHPGEEGNRLCTQAAPHLEGAPIRSPGRCPDSGQQPGEPRCFN